MEIKNLLEQQKEASQKSEQALLDFKEQMERNTSKMYEDMKKQMDCVEVDLGRSKQLREKQAKEFQRQIEDERQRQEQKVCIQYSLFSMTQLLSRYLCTVSHFG